MFIVSGNSSLDDTIYRPIRVYLDSLESGAEFTLNDVRKKTKANHTIVVNVVTEYVHSKKLSKKLVGNKIFYKRINK